MEEEETVSVAELAPDVVGVKTIAAVQEEPAARVAPQVVEATENAEADAPLIWKPMFAAEEPPELVMVTV